MIDPNIERELKALRKDARDLDTEITKYLDGVVDKMPSEAITSMDSIKNRNYLIRNMSKTRQKNA